MYVSFAQLFVLSGYASAIDVAKETNVLLQIGTSEALQCEVKVRTKIIYWWKESSLILEYSLNNGAWQTSGSGNDEGLYNIDANFSLLIQNVTIANEDVYYCEIFNLDTGMTETQQITVTVVGK